MNYSQQYTNEVIFKAAKTNFGGNFLIVLGIWLITPKNPDFQNILILFSVVFSSLSLTVIALGIKYNSELTATVQKKYLNSYLILIAISSLCLGSILVLEGVFQGFLSVGHLGTWVFVVASTEALASFLYHRPKMFFLNFVLINGPSVVWLFSLNTTTSNVLALILLGYGPMIGMRVMELKKLKETMVTLYEKTKSREGHLQTFLDLIPAKITWLNSDLKYIGTNKLFKKTKVGIEKEGLLGVKFGAKHPEAPITKEIQRFLQSPSRSHSCELQVEVLGEPRWHLCEFSKQKFESGDEIFIISIDIDNNRKLQNELETQRGINEQASKFASLGEMAAGIAHEINNPLTIIQGNSQLIKCLHEKDKLTDVLLTKNLNKIIDTSKRIVNIIKGMKDFSRNNSEVEFVTESLQSIIDETLLFCTEKFKVNNILLKLQPIDENILCLCKPQQLNQVLLNLLNNSFDAIVEDPGVKIISIYLEFDKGMQVLCVADTGKTEVDFEKAFTPYYTTKAPGDGTGIGLSISQKISHAHGGFIKAAKEDGKTVFKLHLPLVEDHIMKKAGA
ncbi:MAG: GHKL domain-containing protein [Halobacteriovoraceae bacterium]|nr:GHKL domain-containing protein [Halobacteriovoraceae bacterium]